MGLSAGLWVSLRRLAGSAEGAGGGRASQLDPRVQVEAWWRVLAGDAVGDDAQSAGRPGRKRGRRSVEAHLKVSPATISRSRACAICRKRKVNDRSSTTPILVLLRTSGWKISWLSGATRSGATRPGKAVMFAWTTT